MNRRFAVLLGMLGLAAGTTNAARIVAEYGYDNLIELNNGTARAVLEPNMGGRVISFRLNGVEILQNDPNQDGLRPGRDGVVPGWHCGGRFDIGPVLALEAHNTLWQGAWTGEILGEYTARLTSQIDPDIGIQLVRTFSLDPERARLSCTQVIINHNPEPVRAFFWSRTFVKGGGIALAPIPDKGVFPRSYGLAVEPRGTFNFLPEPEPAIRIRQGILEFLAEPSRQKSIFNLDSGWLAYVSPDDLLFVKTFPFDPDWRYGDVTQHHASFWHSADEIVEMEPNGPLEIIPPHGQASFTETWWLMPFLMPEDKVVDLQQIRTAVAGCQ